MKTVQMQARRVEDTKGVIRIRISKKNRQHNGQKDKQRSTKHTHKTKDRVTRTPSEDKLISIYLMFLTFT
jgi:hypothetical protein